MDWTFWKFLSPFLLGYFFSTSSGESVTLNISKRSNFLSTEITSRHFGSEYVNDIQPRKKRDLQLVISQHFTETNVMPGVDVNLQCVINGVRPTHYVWERDGYSIDVKSEPRFFIERILTPDGGLIMKLNMTQVRIEDGGLYACVAQLGQQSAFHRDRVNVYGPPYIRALSPFKLLSGQSISLHCPYYGYPIKEIVWEYKGKEIKGDVQTERFKRSANNTDYRIEIYGRKPKLRFDLQDSMKIDEHSRMNFKTFEIIDETDNIIIKGDENKKDKTIKIDKVSTRNSKRFEPLHKSENTTIAKHERNATTNKSVFTIKENKKIKRSVREAIINGPVLNIPKVSKSDRGMDYACVVKSPSGEMARRYFELMVVEPPVLEDILLPADLHEGQIVSINCNMKSGDTPVYFSWLKDGQRIPPKLMITERTMDIISVLIIKNVTLFHCGTYTCVAANHVAKVNKTVTMYIRVAPRWNNQPRNQSLLLGRTAHISCNALGYPPPQTLWLKKDVITEAWRPVLEVAGGGVLSLSNGSLIFESVAMTDAGFYACHVENGVGEPLSKTIWVTVDKPVAFDQFERNITAKLGHKAVIECSPKGDHPIRVGWDKNGKPLHLMEPRMKITETKHEDGLTSTLEILQTDVTDSAVYSCRAGNFYGAATFFGNLIVLEPPAVPTDLSVDSIKSRSVKLSWRDMTKSLSQYYNVQITNNSQRLAWNGARSVNVSRTEDIRNSVEIEELLPATSYTARVAGGNQADCSPYSLPVRFTTTEEAPSGPPVSIQLMPTESPGELRVRWLPPPPDAHNGVIIGYRIRAVPQLTGYKESEEASDKVVKTMASLFSKQESILTGLLKGVRYAVSISAFNSAGNGPFSIPQFQDTREGAPEESPSSVECSGVTSTALRVSWQPIPPHKQAGALIGYAINYAPQGRQWQNTTSLVTEVRLQGLLKFTNYTIKVAGFSNYGTGPFSYPIVCSTMQDVPDAPAEVKLLAQSQTSMVISWKKPKQPNGRLLHYTVYYKPTLGHDAPKSIRVEAISNFDAYEKTLMLELKELSNYEQYDAWVTASTIEGEGAQSKKVKNNPSPKVVAGVASLGGEVTVAVRNSLLLECKSVGSPPPRTVWYHNHNIITHHPRFTRNRDDSLLIKSIDQSLSGNYTCLAKNLYGSDSVVYTVRVLPLPDPPSLKATPYKDSIVVEWDEIKSYSNDTIDISYNLTWRESEGPWQEAWPIVKETRLQGIQQHTLTGLKCGTKYSVRVTATDSVGTSAPAYVDVTTLGAAPIAPTTTDWLWSNATHIYIQLSGWDDGGCDVTKWAVEYRLLGSNVWIAAENRAVNSYDIHHGWSYIEGYQSPSLHSLPASYAVGPLAPAHWYQLRVTATNDAGIVDSVYTYATKNLNGDEVGPPSDFLDLNMLVIVCSSILLVICLTAFVCILVRRHRQNYSAQYRHSIADDVKSRNESLASQSETKDRYAHGPPRIYTSPIHNRKVAKNEMFEISPYAEFALGFRTFDHVENQDLPSRLPSRPRFDTETSFQTRSESDDSDSTSKATVALPRRHCRTPHHR